MSEAITDMCALTELTDEIFWAIKYTPSSSLATRGESAEEVKRREQDLKEVVPAHKKEVIISIQPSN